MSEALRDRMKAVAKALGIEIVVPFTLTLTDGLAVEADALVRHFGRRKGTLIFDGPEAAQPFLDRIFEKKIGIAFLVPPVSEQDIDSYIIMFSKWGWSGREKDRPKWVLHYRDMGWEPPINN